MALRVELLDCFGLAFACMGQDVFDPVLSAVEWTAEYVTILSIPLRHYHYHHY